MHLRILRFGVSLLIASALTGVACANREAALRSESRASTTTNGPTSTFFVSTSVPASTTTTTVRQGSITTVPRTTLPASSGVKGAVVFGPVCPVERIPPDPQCAPRPGTADIQLVHPDGSMAAQGRAGPDGQFRVAVVPGRYAVNAYAAAPGPGRGCQVEPAQVTVTPGVFVSVAVACDTGIR